MADKNNQLWKALDRYTATKDRSRRFQITIAVVATCIILFAVGRVLYLLFSTHQGG